MSGLAVDVLALVPIDGVVADQGDDTVGKEVPEEELCQRTPQSDAGPRRPREDALVIGEVPRGQVPQGADQVGDRSAPGGQNRTDQECGESLVGRAGEVHGQNLHQRVRLGW
jgi:hypothetical protein